jgi:hypothetical protein
MFNSLHYNRSICKLQWEAEQIPCQALALRDPGTHTPAAMARIRMDPSPSGPATLAGFQTGPRSRPGLSSCR